MVWVGLLFICTFVFNLSLFALLCDSLSGGQKSQSQSELEPVCLAGKVWAAIQSSLINCQLENATHFYFFLDIAAPD